MKSVAGGLRLTLAAFRALEAFAQLGTELDAAAQGELDRGYRMVEILKQPQFKPMPVTDQIMIIYAGTRGYLDKVPIKDVPAWEAQFLTFMREQRASVRSALQQQRDFLTAEEKKAKVKKGKLETELEKAIQAFQPQFKAPKV